MAPLALSIFSIWGYVSFTTDYEHSLFCIMTEFEMDTGLVGKCEPFDSLIPLLSPLNRQCHDRWIQSLDLLDILPPVGLVLRLPMAGKCCSISQAWNSALLELSAV